MPSASEITTHPPVNEPGAAPPQPRREKLYAEHKKVYPQRISGTFRRLKWAMLIALLGIYYLAPWLRWDRGPGAPDQAILIDMPGRRAYFFWIEIWPQEVYYLVGLLVMGAVGLFLATSLFGRVWCGFTCPQTVWTDLYLLVERYIEGDRNKRIKFDQSGFSVDKTLRKCTKHLVWLLIALATGGAWIMYFNDAPTVLRQFFTGEAGAAVYGFVGLFTATTYLLAGWAREQVCIYMCPWPRFQAAMFDEHTTLVTYEEWRGEPRGHAKAGQSFEGRGHCIDCSLCVRVCPTGVDIRKGQQLACIGCALCVDACNSVMEKIGLPRDLITYDSIANQEARARGDTPKMRFVRPRTIAYASLLLLVVLIMLFALSTRSIVDVSVQPDRAPLFVTLSGGDIRNGYTFKILNKEREARSYRLTMDGLPGAELTVIGYQEQPSQSALLPVAGDSVGTFRVFVKAPRASLTGPSMTLTLVATDEAGGEPVRRDTVFRSPGN